MAKFNLNSSRLTGRESVREIWYCGMDMYCDAIFLNKLRIWIAINNRTIKLYTNLTAVTDIRKAIFNVYLACLTARYNEKECSYAVFSKCGELKCETVSPGRAFSQL